MSTLGIEVATIVVFFYLEHGLRCCWHCDGLKSRFDWVIIGFCCFVGSGIAIAFVFLNTKISKHGLT